MDVDQARRIVAQGLSNNFSSKHLTIVAAVAGGAPLPYGVKEFPKQRKVAFLWSEDPDDPYESSRVLLVQFFGASGELAEHDDPMTVESKAPELKCGQRMISHSMIRGAKYMEICTLILPTRRLCAYVNDSWLDPDLAEEEDMDFPSEIVARTSGGLLGTYECDRRTLGLSFKDEAAAVEFVSALCTVFGPNAGRICP